MYVFVFGFYSVFKFRADKIKPKFVQFVLKALYAFITTFISYALLLFVFPSPVLTNDFSDMTTGIVIAFFVLFVITFMLYDFATKIMFVLYNSRLRPRIMKKR